MAKICVFTSHPVTDRRVFRREAIALRKHGFEVVVVGAGDGEERYQDGVKLIPVAKAPGLCGRYRFLRKVRQIVRSQEGVDVYHTHDFDQMQNALHIMKKTGRPMVLDVHERYPSMYSRLHFFPECFWASIENHYARRVHNIISVYDQESERFAKCGCNVLTLDNYATLHDFPPATISDDLITERACNIIHTGMVCPAYRSDILLYLCREVPKSVPAVRFWICENAPDKKHFEWFRGEIEKDSNTCVEFLPFMPLRELREHVNRAAVGLSLLDTQFFEDARPTKFSEQMSLGVPIVSSRYPYSEIILEKSQAGVVVDAETPESYRHAVVDLLLNRDKREGMGRSGIKFFVEQYNWGVVESKFVDYFERIVLAP